MANDDDFERRFPLRRPAPEPEAAPAPRAQSPAPAPGGWSAKSQAKIKDLLDTLELSGGLPPPAARTPAPPRDRSAEVHQPRWTPPPAPPRPPLELVEPAPAAAGSYTTNLPVRYRIRPWKWVVRGFAAFIAFFILAVGWLALTAPLSKSLEPPAPPSITLLAADGKTPIARRGAVILDPVDAAKLPSHVRDAFVAIEDRRFYSHWGIDLRGITRALVNNLSGNGRSQGGSTITQQLAKNAFLNSDRTATRKFQEVLIAFWLEGWLTKDEILSRYLSFVYFGDNVYGLRAAARHYFSCDPEDLTPSQATMLAGLVQAPSRLAPTGNLAGARARQKLVIAAMVDSELITESEARRIRPAVLKPEKSKQIPNGGYFADWVLPQARDRSGEIATEQTVRTTMETRAQRAAERAVRNAGLRKSQVAIVAMHPDGRVVAMVGGTNYGESPFNRATQARRQPGSAFKLFVYLAALRSGMTPDTIVDDSPVDFGGWSPENSHGQYSGKITLRQAFAKSSNVVAARLTRQLGVAAVTRAARDLGISTPIGNDASIALGTSTVSLLEITAAYASVAQGAYPVRPTGLTGEVDQDWLGRTLGGPAYFRSNELASLRSLLASVVESGTGRGAALSIPAYGKTGTTQDNRDALFIGYADDLVVGVWLGNDDNSPNAGLAGSGLPARIWRDFMVNALDIPVAPPPPAPAEDESDNGSVGLDDLLDGIGKALGDGSIETETEFGGDGSQQRDGPRDAPRRPREDATLPPGPRIETRVERPPPRPKGVEGDRRN